MNRYTHKFVAACPNNGLPIFYTLIIEVPANRMIQIEHIATATALIKEGYHEKIADQLHARFGGHLVLVAHHHHNTDIESIREAA